MKFKPGDTVVVHKPDKNDKYGLFWVRGMDQYDNIVTTIKSYHESSSKTFHLDGCGDYFFADTWLSPCEDDEDINVEDISLIM